MPLRISTGRIVLFVFVLFAALLLFAHSARADRCYEVPIFDTPDSTDVPMDRNEVWCYGALPAPIGDRYVYKVEDGHVKPETSVLISTDGALTHGSRAFDTVRIVKTKTGFNPFLIPLNEPTSIESMAAPPASSVKRERDTVLKQFRAGVAIESLGTPVVEGTFAKDASPFPFRGSAWSFKSRLMDQPLAKLDRLAQSRGSTSNGVAWEDSHHADHGLSWAGHCNGWAASSILRREPVADRRDPQTGLIFTVADQKGLFAEKDYCVSFTMYGRRFPNGTLDDVSPAVFHQTITYYLGQLGKPVAADVNRDASIRNHVFSGYRMTIRRDGAHAFTVDVDLRDHAYDQTPFLPPGVAPAKWSRYSYTLTTDNAGNPNGGNWISGNPDFLWVPLAPATCGDQNPAVTEAWLSKIANF